MTNDMRRDTLLDELEMVQTNREFITSLREHPDQIEKFIEAVMQPIDDAGRSWRSPRNLAIIKSRYIKCCSLRTVGDEFGLVGERVRQITNRFLRVATAKISLGIIRIDNGQVVVKLPKKEERHFPENLLYDMSYRRCKEGSYHIDCSIYKSFCNDLQKLSTENMNKIINRVLTGFNGRDIDIFKEHYVQEMTVSEISQKYGIGEPRVNQIIVKELKEMRRAAMDWRAYKSP